MPPPFLPTSENQDPLQQLIALGNMFGGASASTGSAFPSLQMELDYNDAVQAGDKDRARELLLAADAKRVEADAAEDRSRALRRLAALGLGIAAGGDGSYGAFGPHVAKGLLVGTKLADEQERADELGQYRKALTAKGRASLAQSAQRQDLAERRFDFQKSQPKFKLVGLPDGTQAWAMFRPDGSGYDVMRDNETGGPLRPAKNPALLVGEEGFGFMDPASREVGRLPDVVGKPAAAMARPYTTPTDQGVATIVGDEVKIPVDPATGRPLQKPVQPEDRLVDAATLDAQLTPYLGGFYDTQGQWIGNVRKQVAAREAAGKPMTIKELDAALKAMEKSVDDDIRLSSQRDRFERQRATAPPAAAAPVPAATPVPGAAPTAAPLPAAPPPAPKPLPVIPKKGPTATVSSPRPASTPAPPGAKPAPTATPAAVKQADDAPELPASFAAQVQWLSGEVYAGRVAPKATALVKYLVEKQGYDKDTATEFVRAYIEAAKAK